MINSAHKSFVLGSWTECFNHIKMEIPGGAKVTWPCRRRVN